jgi:hypothetical protein
MNKLATCLLASAVLLAGEEQWYRERPISKDAATKQAFFGDSDQMFPHFATGGGWETVLVIVNMTNRRMDFTQEFHGPDGQLIPVTFRSIPDGVVTTTSTTQGTLQPGGSFNILLTDNGGLRTGWASLDYNTSLGRLGGYATFRQRSAGRPDFEALVPLSAYDDHKFFLPIDNLEGFVTAIAIANPASIATNVKFTLLDMSGREVSNTTLALPPMGQTSFEIAKQFPATAGRVGTLYVEGTTNRLSAIGLRFNPQGAFSSVPIMNWSGMFP